MSERHRLIDENNNNNKQEQQQQLLPLYIRYSSGPWIAFDDTNASIQHQKRGLKLFIASGKNSLDVSIPHANGGQFIVEFGKNIYTSEETGKNTIVYYYIKNNLETVQMMYTEPSYIAYINRVVGEID